MRLLITGGTLEAEIQNNPLDRIQKQLASISQKTELDIDKLRSDIDKKFDIKDKHIDDLYVEEKERERLEEIEIDELRTMILSIAKEVRKPLNTSEISGIKTKLESLSLSQKAFIKKITDKIEHIEKDRIERIKKFKEDIVTISNSGSKKISLLKNDISNIVKGIKVTQPNQGKVVDGRPYMGHLNFKPKLPI